MRQKRRTLVLMRALGERLSGEVTEAIEDHTCKLEPTSRCVVARFP